MRMRRKTPVISSIALLTTSAALAASLIALSSVSSAASGITSFAGIVSDCSAAQDSSGFGSATLTNSVTVSHQTASLSVPCTIHLTNGAKLTIQSSTITTAKLIVADDSPGTSGSSFVIQSSTVTGYPNSGLLVQLQHASDSITVDKSTVSYPLSVYLLIQNTDGSGTLGAIEANHDTITSNATNTDGIHLVADGSGIFQSLTLQSNSSNDDHLALLYTPSCSEQNVTGAPSAC